MIAGPWRFEGQVLSQGDVKQPYRKGPFVIERPKVLYNNVTGKFVMWFHLDDAKYKYRRAGVAQSDSPGGRFQYVHGIRPDGLPSLDLSLFRDPVDGQGYLIRSVDNKYTGISRLSRDYLHSTGVISNHSVFEGMAIFRHPNGTYYCIASHLSGWAPNPLMLLRAEGKTLDDPRWVNMGNPTGDPTSFNSQPTYVVRYTPQRGSPYFVYLADNWIRCRKGGGTAAASFGRNEAELPHACYIWLPINFHDKAVTIEYRTKWELEDPFGAHAKAKPRVRPIRPMNKQTVNKTG